MNDFEPGVPGGRFVGVKDEVIGELGDLTLVTPDAEEALLPVSVELDPLRGQAAALAQARAFLEAVLGGASLKEAATVAGSSLTLLRRDSDVRRYIRDAKKRYEATDKEVREFVRLKWLDMAVNSADRTERAHALDQLSKIPEVGLKPGGGRPPERRGDVSPETRGVLEALDD